LYEKKTRHISDITYISSSVLNIVLFQNNVHNKKTYNFGHLKCLTGHKQVAVQYSEHHQ
jgi:hypothetical protein